MSGERRGAAALVARLAPSWDGVLVVDPTGRVLPESAETDAGALAEVVHPDDAGVAHAVLAAMAGRTLRESGAAWRVRDADGGWAATETLVLNLLDDADVGAIVVTFRRIAEREPESVGAAAPAAEPDGGRATAAPAGGATVLVVDDHDANRALIRRILSRAGHAVVEAGDADSARERFTADAAVPDLLLTDVVLPGESGAALADGLRARMPGLPVVFVSGYGTLLDRYGVVDELVVAKPFRADELLAAVQAALAR